MNFKVADNRPKSHGWNTFRRYIGQHFVQAPSRILGKWCRYLPETPDWTRIHRQNTEYKARDAGVSHRFKEGTTCTCTAQSLIRSSKPVAQLRKPGSLRVPSLVYQDTVQILKKKLTPYHMRSVSPCSQKDRPKLVDCAEREIARDISKKGETYYVQNSFKKCDQRSRKDIYQIKKKIRQTFFIKFKIHLLEQIKSSQCKKLKSIKNIWTKFQISNSHF